MIGGLTNRLVGGLTNSLISGNNTFSPLSLNPVVWLRSDLGITVDGSNNVQTWNDQSGNSNTVSQSTAGNRPNYVSSGGANNRPYILLGNSGGATNTTLATTSAFTVGGTSEIFCVMRPTAYTGVAGANGVFVHAYGSTDTSENSVFQLANNPSEFDVYNAGLILNTYLNVPIGADCVLEMCVQPGVNGTFGTLNGTTTYLGNANTTTTEAGNLYIGSYVGIEDYAQGYMYEVIMFNSVLTSGQRAQLLAYVTATYGIAT